MNKYDEALKDFDDNFYLALRYAENDKITRLKVTTRQTLTEALTKAKLFDEMVDARKDVVSAQKQYKLLTDANDDSCVMARVKVQDRWDTFNKLCANLTEKYVKES